MTEFSHLRFFYGIDPLTLTWHQYKGYLDRLPDVYTLDQGGGTDHAAKVASMVNRRDEI